MGVQVALMLKCEDCCHLSRSTLDLLEQTTFDSCWKMQEYWNASGYAIGEGQSECWISDPAYDAKWPLLVSGSNSMMIDRPVLPDVTFHYRTSTGWNLWFGFDYVTLVHRLDWFALVRDETWFNLTLKASQDWASLFSASSGFLMGDTAPPPDGIRNSAMFEELMTEPFNEEFDNHGYGTVRSIEEFGTAVTAPYSFVTYWQFWPCVQSQGLPNLT